MSFLDADRAVFVSDFGTTVVTADGGACRGALKLQWLEEPDPAGYPIRVQRPTLLVVKGEVERPSPDDVVTVGGVAYRYRGQVNASPDAARALGGLETWVLAEVST